MKNNNINKFVLVAYEKGNISNRKLLKFSVKTKNGKIKELDKYGLPSIDRVTSGYSYVSFYQKLLEKGAIKKGQFEFVIWCQQKDRIVQFPVIFCDERIKMYAEYVENSSLNSEEHTINFDTLNNNVFYKFVHKLDIDSSEYDRLSEEEKEDFVNGDSFTARFLRVPFVLKEEQNRALDRILGPYQYKDEKRVKSVASIERNRQNIKNGICGTYRSFREKYLFLKDTTLDYENLYKDLTIEDLEVKEEIKNEVNDIQENTQLIVLNEILGNYSEEKKYDDDDYINIICNKEIKESFEDFIYYQTSLPKKIKDYTHMLLQDSYDFYGGSDSNKIYNEGKIRDYAKEHSDIINKVIHTYYKFIKEQKINTKQKVI